MKIIDGGVTAPQGFLAAGGSAGIKKAHKDLALLQSTVPAVAAACFTTNVVKAAPVLRDMELIRAGGKICGVAVNSGNANACTGAQGMADNAEMALAFARFLQVPGEQVLTASTGVIGAPFPIAAVKAGIAELAPTLGGGRADAKLAAEAIMTTDTYSKEIAVSLEIGGKTVTIGGMAKGSGMINPQMATMLGFVTTDCAISKAMLQQALSADVELTYNMVSVDGDTSTNDTILVLANGLAGNPEITEKNADYEAFAAALHLVNETLAKHLVRDGEGATKLIQAEVTGAKTEADARTLAKSVIQSSLVKAAMFGQDANWGRILCAMGYSGVAFDPLQVSIRYSSPKGAIDLFEKGVPLAFDEEKALEILKETDITVHMLLGEGEASAVAWGCDLSYDYVKINGDYRS